MKAVRVVGIVLGVVFVAMTVRALYLQRVWTVARIWAKLPPTLSPHPVAFFLPDAWGTTAHGGYADIVFLKVRNSPARTAAILAMCARHSIVPNPPTSRTCKTADWYRVDPARVHPKNLAACYGVADKFAMSDARKEKGFRLDASIGGWISSDDRGYLCVAVYRTR